MPSRKDFETFQSDWFSKAELEHGPLTLTIRYLKQEDVKSQRGTDRKPILYFVEDVKPFILGANVNYDAIASMYGEDYTQWGGKQIELFFDPNVMFGAERTGGVRIRIPGGIPSGNGNVGALAPQKEVWGFTQALEKAAAFGITREKVVAKLKEKGFEAWKSSECTPLVQEMLEQEIPF